MLCAEDSERGPDREQGSMAEEDAQFAGDKPDPKDIPTPATTAFEALQLAMLCVDENLVCL